jgi:hypothetical protein
MLTLHSIAPLLTETVPLPPMNTKGRLVPRSTVISLDVAAALPAGADDWVKWPEFHNGVAAGLRLVRHS